MPKFCIQVYTCDHKGDYNILLHTFYIEGESEELVESMVDAWIRNQPIDMVYIIID